MTSYDKIKEYLDKYPRARERRNRNEFITWILWNEYRVDRGISQEQLKNLIVSSESYLRTWRKVTQDNEHLRGKDYFDKKLLEEEKMIELGYQAGIAPVIKKVGEITKPYNED